jgi:hypothetical protein
LVATSNEQIAPETSNTRLRGLAQRVLLQFPRDWTPTEIIRKRFDLPPQLRDVAMYALQQNTRNRDGARDAVFEAVRNDPELLWLLFEPYRGIAVQKLLSRVADEMRANERARKLPGAGAVSAVPLNGCSPPPTTGPFPVVGRKPVPADRPTAAKGTSGMVSVAETAQSMLDSFIINKQPIGQKRRTRQKPVAR